MSDQSGRDRRGPQGAERAKFRILTGPNRGTLEVHFNPESLEYTLTNNIQRRGQGNNNKQYVSQSSAKLSMDLVFDTTDTGVDVRGFTVQFQRMMKPATEGRDKVPSVVEFRWGSYSFRGVFESYKETLDFFAPAGVPLRATVKVSLAQQDRLFEPGRAPAEQQSRRLQVPQAAGQPLAQTTGDPRAARDVGSQNGVEDLRRPPGGDLEVDDEPELQPASGFSPAATLGVQASLSAGIELGDGAEFGAGAGFGIEGGIGGSFGAAGGIGFGAAGGIGFGAAGGIGFGAAGGIGFEAGLGFGGGIGLDFGAGIGGLTDLLDAAADFGAAVTGVVNAFAGGAGGFSGGPGGAGGFGAGLPGAGGAQAGGGGGAVGGAFGAGVGSAGGRAGGLDLGPFAGGRASVFAQGQQGVAAAAAAPAGPAFGARASAGVPAALGAFVGLHRASAAPRATRFRPAEALPRQPEAVLHTDGAAVFEIGGRAVQPGPSGLRADVGARASLASFIRFDEE